MGGRQIGTSKKSAPALATAEPGRWEPPHNLQVAESEASCREAAEEKEQPKETGGGEGAAEGDRGRRTVAREIHQPESLVVQAACVERALAAGAGAVEVDCLGSAGSGAAFGEGRGRGAGLEGRDGRSERIEQRGFA